jgi:hypothetical protein
MLSLGGPMAMSCGEKSPVAANVVWKFPLESNLSMRLFAASTTYTRPDESVTAPCGLLNWPDPLPDPPKMVELGPKVEAAPAEAGMIRATSAPAKPSAVAILRISRYPHQKVWVPPCRYATGNPPLNGHH